MAVIEIKLEQLKIHPKNVRTEYEGIDELAKSIKENGIMHLGDGRYSVMMEFSDRNYIQYDLADKKSMFDERP